MNKYKITVKIFIFILFISFNLYAQETSTRTASIELTQEQKDWNNILSLSVDRIDAFKLAKKDIKYNYLSDKINRTQAVIELVEEKIERNKILSRGYFGHIYDIHIDNRVKKIEIGDRR